MSSLHSLSASPGWSPLKSSCFYHSVSPEKNKRTRKRLRAITFFKQGDEYAMLRNAGIPVPEAPDPNDAGISKRTWEHLVGAWKQGVREAAQKL